MITRLLFFLLPAVFLLTALSLPASAQDSPSSTHQGAGRDGSSGMGKMDAGQDVNGDGGMDAGPHARHARQRPIPVLKGTAGPAGRMLRPAERTHLVFGYHPYWIPDSVAALYRYELLSHLAYFSAEVDPVSGEITDTRGWLTSPVIGRAKASGVKIHLVVTNFGIDANRTLLRSPAARDTLIRRIIALVRLRNADGVNIDFEPMPRDQRGNLITFFADLDAALAAELPGAEISAALPAVDWDSSWDAPALARHVDLIFLMCYDYWWSGSNTAGPVAPIQGATYTVTRSLDDWLHAGIPPGKTVLGVPYYGYDWPVRSGTPQSLTQGAGVARVYSRVAEMLQRYDRQWSSAFLNPWFPYQVADWRQVWYDDAESLEYKYMLVKDRGIAGAGIWALGYDGDIPELWDLLARMFTRPTSVAALPAGSSIALEVYPQPVRAGSPAFCRLRAGGGGEMRLVLRDLLGRVVWDARLEGTATRAALPVHELHPGTYVLELASGAGRLMRPLVVLR